MANKVAFSNSHTTIEKIEKFYFYSEQSLKPYFSVNNSYFTGYTLVELENEFKDQKLTLERMSSLETLAFLEARFRIDYLIRSEKRMRDRVSKEFRLIYQQVGNRASLVDDILKVWRKIHPEYKRPLDNFQKSLDYRNWLAHGRYWEPKKSPHIKNYDYFSIKIVANEILENIDLIES